MFTLYSLAVQQLSKQDHYDFGLRALTSLLRYAGKKRRSCGNVPDEEVGFSLSLTLKKDFRTSYGLIKTLYASITN